MVEGVGFADVAIVSGVVCGLAVEEGSDAVRLVVVVDVVSRFNTVYSTILSPCFR